MRVLHDERLRISDFRRRQGRKHTVACVLCIPLLAELANGRMLDLVPGDPQLRYLDRAWASTVNAFPGRTVDTVIAAMEAGHPHLTM